MADPTPDTTTAAFEAAKTNLAKCRDGLEAAHRAHRAKMEAAARGNPSSHRETRAALDLAQQEHQAAAKIYERASQGRSGTRAR